MHNMTWRDVWQRGIAPLLPLAGLQALGTALRTDDPSLLAEDATTRPMAPDKLDNDVPCEAACAVGYGVWKGLGLHGCREVEKEFDRVMGRAGGIISASGKRRFVYILPFVQWWDNPDMPRKRKFALLLKEVEAELTRRQVA